MKPGGRRWQRCRACSVSSDWQSTTSNSTSPLTSSPSTPSLPMLLLMPLATTSHSMADTAHAKDQKHKHLTISCSSSRAYKTCRKVYIKQNILKIKLDLAFVWFMISAIYTDVMSLFILLIPFYPAFMCWWESRDIPIIHVHKHTLYDDVKPERQITLNTNPQRRWGRLVFKCPHITLYYVAISVALYTDLTHFFITWGLHPVYYTEAFSSTKPAAHQLHFQNKSNNSNESCRSRL